MKKSCRELLKKNNEMEKEINSINESIYTDMIVYLRGSDMTEYNQELVREDLISMILHGQSRGDNIEKVMGKNYKDICDEIIEAMPKRTRLQKAMSIFTMSISVVWIVGIIYLIRQAIEGFVNGSDDWNFTLSAGDVLNMGTIIIAANFIVWYVCKNSFKKERNKVILFIRNWIVCMVFFGALIIPAYFLKTVLVNVSFITAAMIVAGVFILDKIVSRIVDERIM